MKFESIWARKMANVEMLLKVSKKHMQALRPHLKCVDRAKARNIKQWEKLSDCNLKVTCKFNDNEEKSLQTFKMLHETCRSGAQMVCTVSRSPDMANLLSYIKWKSSNLYNVFDTINNLN